MRINEIVSISGLGGLYKIETQKVNGLIVTSLNEGWTKFISNRQHLFSPFENISIYTDSDNIELSDVMIKIQELIQSFPLPDTKSSHEELRQWFINMVPNHDQDKVYVSDIKKIIKWYSLLQEKGIITQEIEARQEETKKQETSEEKTEEKSS